MRDEGQADTKVTLTVTNGQCADVRAELWSDTLIESQSFVFGSPFPVVNEDHPPSDTESNACGDAFTLAQATGVNGAIYVIWDSWHHARASELQWKDSTGAWHDFNPNPQRMDFRCHSWNQGDNVPEGWCTELDAFE